MKKLFLLAFTVAAFVGCSKDNDSEPPYVVCPHGTRVSFEADEALADVDGEAVVLGDADVVYSGTVDHSVKNIFWPKDLANAYGQTDEFNQIYWQGPYVYSADGVVMLGGYYNDSSRADWGGTISDVWGGFVLSKNANVADKESKLSSQFAVWAAGGANDTETFAVGYDSNSAGESFGMVPIEYNAPQIEFARKVSPYQVFLANSTFVYPYFTGKAADKFTVTIIGWNGATEGKSVVCTLVDGATKVSGWVAVDLSSLGTVDKLTFKVASSDLNAPFYFCLDDLCFD